MGLQARMRRGPLVQSLFEKLLVGDQDVDGAFYAEPEGRC